MKRKISIIALLALIIGLVPTNNVSAAEKISISKKTISLTVGKSKKLKLNNAKKSKVKWSSSKKKVATVSKSGKVTAKKKGTAKITARYLGKKYNCKVVVKSKTPSNSSASTAKPTAGQEAGSAATPAAGQEVRPTATPAGKINVSSSSIDLTQTAQISLSGATAKSWSSSDEEIATVDHGLVTPLSVGSVTIFCVDTSGFQYSCKITIGYPDIMLSANTIYSQSIGGTMYYGIDFVVTNNCDYDIKFGGKESMTDNDVTCIFYYQYGFNQGVTTAFALAESSPFNVSGNQNPTITCRKGYETTVYAFEGKTKYVPSAYSHFLWTITINGKKYTTVTDFYGEIVAMVLCGDSDI